MNKKENNVYNYFIIINSFIQPKLAIKLQEEFGLTTDYNICIYRYVFLNKPKKDYCQEFDRTYSIPYFKSKFRIVKWINFFIYIIIFSAILFRNPVKGNLIIGNFLYHGNKFISNVFTTYWKNIFVLDEGTSTLGIYEERSKNIKKIRLIDRIFFTFQPKKKLIFYTIFNLPNNNYDNVHHIVELFKLDNKHKEVGPKSLLFIGTDLVESKIITKEYFNILLKKLRDFNPEIDIIYIPHPREICIYDNHIVQELGIKICKTTMSIEEHLLIKYSNYKILASCVSTGFIYANFILGNSVNYQTYILDKKQIKGNYFINHFSLVYKTIQEKLLFVNNRNIPV